MLDQDSIQIWRVALAGSSPQEVLQSRAQIEALWAKLSLEEQRRADAFRREGIRRDYVIAHAALRQMLGDYLGLPAAEVQFAKRSFDGDGLAGSAPGHVKPALLNRELHHPSGGHSAPDIRFNLSHTRGMALIAVALGRELGVDIEFQRPMEDLEAMARSVMSHHELEHWRAIPDADRERAFYRIWTRKEAYLKAIGLGLYRNLLEVTVPATALELDSMQAVQDRNGSGHWSVRDVVVVEDYVASICCEGKDSIDVTAQDFPLSAIRL